MQEIKLHRENRKASFEWMLYYVSYTVKAFSFIQNNRNKLWVSSCKRQNTFQTQYNQGGKKTSTITKQPAELLLISKRAH